MGIELQSLQPLFALMAIHSARLAFDENNIDPRIRGSVRKVKQREQLMHLA
jgi:hypothetical protein